MLTIAQRDRIRQDGYCSYHDVELWAHTEGEPFLVDDLVYYFDGRRLFLCGYSLTRSEKNIIEHVKALARHCYRLLPVESLIYCGPRDISFRQVCPHRHRLIAKMRAEAIGAELLVDCEGPLASSRSIRSTRLLDRLGMEVRAIRGGACSLEARHRSLIEQFFANREITPYLLDMAFLLPVMMWLEKVVWLEALIRGELCGLAVISDAFVTADLAVFMATDPARTHVSDCLYAAVLDSARKRGKRYVNLGSSPNAGIFRYKQRWGGEPTVSPYWLCEWSHGDLARASYTSWPSRLVQYDFKPQLSH